MRFLVDECVGPSVARWLREAGHDVFDAYTEARGMSSDEALLAIAYRERRIIVTSDKDFGEKVYRERHPHWGIVLLRLKDERPVAKIRVMQMLLENHSGMLEKHFVVATEDRVRIAK